MIPCVPKTRVSSVVRLEREREGEGKKKGRKRDVCLSVCTLVCEIDRKIRRFGRASANT